MTLLLLFGAGAGVAEAPPTVPGNRLPTLLAQVQNVQPRLTAQVQNVQPRLKGDTR